MADAALATQARNASGVSRVERSPARGAVSPVRSVGQADAFQRNLQSGAGAGNVTAIQPQQEQPSGSGLLSTGVQMLLAETRTQEDGAPSVAPSKVGRALNSYLATQAKVRETIRDSAAVANLASRAQSASA